MPTGASRSSPSSLVRCPLPGVACRPPTSKRLVTRVYFPDEAEANDADPVLSAIADPQARSTLVAREEDGALRFDIRLQGERETAFFSL
jgi:protocatechuate 3,4-dioxygenase beta subunit